MVFYPWFPVDYAGDALVKAMSDDQDLAYRRLLDISWQIGPLPSEPSELATLVRYDQERFDGCWRFPLNECWHQNGDGKLINHRLENEREKVKNRSEKARLAVKVREKNRRKRLKAKGIKGPIVRSSNDNRSVIHPKPYPDPKPKEKQEKIKDLCRTSSTKDEIPDGVFWSDDGIQMTEEWKAYLRNYLKEYGAALDKIAPSSKGLALTLQDFQAELENLNARLLENRYLRPGPRSKPPKWKQFRTLVRNHFVKALNNKRRYKPRTALDKRQASDAIFAEFIKEAEEEERGGKQNRDI